MLIKKINIIIEEITKEIPTNIQYKEIFFLGTLQTITDDCFLFFFLTLVFDLVLVIFSFFESAY